jgi:hypothetical protein
MVPPQELASETFLSRRLADLLIWLKTSEIPCAASAWRLLQPHHDDAGSLVAVCLHHQYITVADEAAVGSAPSHALREGDARADLVTLG